MEIENKEGPLGRDLGKNICMSNGRWSFADSTPIDFSSHIQRSVPGYNEGHRIIIKLSDYFLKDKSTCLELGVSTGALIKKIAKYHYDLGNHNIEWIGIDKVQEMLDQARTEINKYDDRLKNINLILGDLINFKFCKSDLIISYYTIQFIETRYREDIIRSIYQSLHKGGGFIWFEKVYASESFFQDILNTLYQNYKQSEGHTPSQILEKINSLKGVLVPLSSDENIELLRISGFTSIQPIYQNLSFQGILAIK